MQNYNSKYKSDLKKRCYYYSLDVIALIGSLSQNTVTRIISNQLLRSATSIGANLVEAGSSSSRLEFKKFHEIALRSANETKYWLELLRDSNLISTETVDKLLNEVNELANMIASGILKLKYKSNL